MQAALDLRWAHMSEGMFFFDVEAQIKSIKVALETKNT